MKLEAGSCSAHKKNCDGKRKVCLLKFSMVVVICVTGILLGNNVSPVMGEDEDAHKSSTKFELWVRPTKGYNKSVAVYEGERLSIRCRVKLNETELKDSDDLSEVSMTISKDNVTLPDYWMNKTAAEMANVTRHSKFAFDYEQAEQSHRGVYKCEAVYKGQKKIREFLVRVKVEKLELPALLIGVQILILGVIFFVYERRQKRQEAKFKAEGAAADADAGRGKND